MQATQKQQEIWLSVADAAKRLGIKPRRMLDYAEKITSTRVPNPKSGKSVLMFQQSSVDWLAEQRKRVTETGLARIPRGNTAIAPLHQAAIAPQTTAQPAWKPWLTLNEAVTFSGLTRAWLLHRAETGDLPEWIRDMGKGSHGGRWRFLRSALCR